MSTVRLIKKLEELCKGVIGKDFPTLSTLANDSIIQITIRPEEGFKECGWYIRLQEEGSKYQLLLLNTGVSSLPKSRFFVGGYSWEPTLFSGKEVLKKVSLVLQGKR